MLSTPIEHGLSVVVPVYNSRETLPALIDRLAEVLPGLGMPYELILVNDGSRDGTWEIIAECASTRPWARGFDLMRNYGQHNALLCGVRQARYSLTVTLDDDLQNPPDEIPKMLAALTDEIDVVYGMPRGGPPSAGSRLLRLALASALGAKTTRIAGSFRLFRTRLRDAFADSQSPLVVLDIYLNWATSRFAAVEVAHRRRAGGATGYTLRRRISVALDMVTGFSTLPLKVATLVGFFFALFGVALLAYQLVVYLLHPGEAVPGFMFLASTIAIFAGAQLFALGIIGEYLGRMYQRVMGRPPYTVAETTPAATQEERSHG